MQQCLLPRGCFKAVPCSDIYVESYKCNFLGLDPKISIPPHVNKDEKYLLIDVFRKHGSVLDGSTDPFGGYEFQFSSPVTFSPSKLQQDRVVFHL